MKKFGVVVEVLSADADKYPTVTPPELHQHPLSSFLKHLSIREFRKQDLFLPINSYLTLQMPECEPIKLNRFFTFQYLFNFFIVTDRFLVPGFEPLKILTAEMPLCSFLDPLPVAQL
jgi:hypothetical protein